MNNVCSLVGHLNEAPCFHPNKHGNHQIVTLDFMVDDHDKPLSVFVRDSDLIAHILPHMVPGTKLQILAKLEPVPSSRPDSTMVYAKIEAVSIAQVCRLPY